MDLGLLSRRANAQRVSAPASKTLVEASDNSFFSGEDVGWRVKVTDVTPEARVKLITETRIRLILGVFIIVYSVWLDIYRLNGIKYIENTQ